MIIKPKSVTHYNLESIDYSKMMASEDDDTTDSGTKGMVEVVLGSGGDDTDGNRGVVDSMTEVDYSSWGDRMRSSCGGICIGLLFFFGSFGVLFWNEGRAVRRQRDLDEGVNAVVKVGNVKEHSAFPDNQNINDKLVYVTGILQQPNGNDDSSLALFDPLFDLNITDATSSASTETPGGVNTGALKYSRAVETYQWVERSSSKTIKTSNGGTKTETTYSYDKVWSTVLISSDDFKEVTGHVNPSRSLVDPLTIQADRVTLDKYGHYALDDGIFNYQVNWWSNWNDPPINLSSTLLSDPEGNRSVQFADGGSTIYVGNNTNAPAIGDTRVSFQLVLPDTVSMVAEYSYEEGILEAYTTSRGGEILFFTRGNVTSDELFAQAEANNTTATWFLRFVGFLAMCFGIVLMLQPLAVFVDIIPVVGDFLEAGLQSCIIPTIAFLISFPLSLLTISIAWVFYRPIFLVISLVLTGGLVYFVHKAVQAKKQATEPQASSSAEKTMDDKKDAEAPAPTDMKLEIEIEEEEVEVEGK